MTRWVQASDVQVQASDVQDEATVTVVSVPGPLSSGVMSQALSLSPLGGRGKEEEGD